MADRVRERLVVEARDQVQVRVAENQGAVPDERVTVRREALVLGPLSLEQTFVGCCPLLVQGGGPLDAAISEAAVLWRCASIREPLGSMEIPSNE